MNEGRGVAKVGVLVVALCGMPAGAETGGPARGAEPAHSHGAHGHGAPTATGADDHDHEGVHRVAAAQAPSLALGVRIDTQGRFVLILDTQDFQFSREHADGAHVDGEGHAHIYVDGVKLGRIYAREHPLEGLEPGRREVRVALFTNDHRAYASDAGRAEITIVLLVPRPRVEMRAGDAVVHGVSIVEGRATPPSVRVEQGDLVGLAWESDVARDLHLHGYDVEQHVARGGSATTASARPAMTSGGTKTRRGCQRRRSTRG